MDQQTAQWIADSVAWALVRVCLALIAARLLITFARAAEKDSVDLWPDDETKRTGPDERNARPSM